MTLLDEMKLVDHTYELKHHDQTVSIPLLRPPSRSELDGILHDIRDALLEDDQFQPRRRHARTLQESLKNKVPSNVLGELPKSYDVIGDIAVVELSSRLDTIAEILAKELLNIHPNVRSVFARAGPVEGSERIRPLRHLAGEYRTTTVHREFGCSFKVDLSSAFFSPRLSTEHRRVAQQVQNGEHVVDMFSGVGPFSILIAKTVTNIEVEAIDANPAAIRLVEENARVNKVDSKVHIHSGDAQVIVRELGPHATRVIMNHPSAAKHFVAAACEAIPSQGGILHYYTFAEGDDAEVGAEDELNKAIAQTGRRVRKFHAVHKVREVGPMNWQIVIDAQVA